MCAMGYCRTRDNHVARRAAIRGSSPQRPATWPIERHRTVCRSAPMRRYADHGTTHGAERRHPSGRRQRHIGTPGTPQILARYSVIRVIARVLVGVGWQTKFIPIFAGVRRVAQRSTCRRPSTINHPGRRGCACSPSDSPRSAGDGEGGCRTEIDVGFGRCACR